MPDDRERLRSKIAEIVWEWDIKHRDDEIIDSDGCASAILAIPELAEALRLKPIKNLE